LPAGRGAQRQRASPQGADGGVAATGIRQGGHDCGEPRGQMSPSARAAPAADLRVTKARRPRPRRHGGSAVAPRAAQACAGPALQCVAGVSRRHLFRCSVPRFRHTVTRKRAGEARHQIPPPGERAPQRGVQGSASDALQLQEDYGTCRRCPEANDAGFVQPARAASPGDPGAVGGGERRRVDAAVTAANRVLAAELERRGRAGVMPQRPPPSEDQQIGSHPPNVHADQEATGRMCCGACDVRERETPY